MELKVIVDLEAQTVVSLFDPKEFKTWDMVIFALDAARRDAEGRLQLQRMAGMQRQAQQQMQADALANKILRG